MGSTGDTPLLVERDSAVLRLTLNRPQRANVLDLALCKALLDAAILADEDDAVRCVVLAARGKLFCAGGDIDAFVAAGDALGPLVKQMTAALHMALARLLRMNKPLVTVVAGPAAGAGLSLAILGDIALAARSAHFTSAYTTIGMTPDGGSTWLLPRLVGMRRAQEMVLLNRRVSAEEAAQLGLITRAVPDEALAAEADSVVQQLAQGATAALGRSRNLLHSSFTTTLETHLEAEARAIADSARTEDARTRMAAFLQKRKPT